MLEEDEATNIRIVACEACGTEGRIYKRYFGSTHPDDEYDAGPCPACNGTGDEIIEMLPIEMEDLDA